MSSNNVSQPNSSNVSADKKEEKSVSAIGSNLAANSIRSAEDVFGGQKSISEEETKSISEDNEKTLKEAERREKLTHFKSQTDKYDDQKTIPSKKSKVDDTIAQIKGELPTDIAGCLTWINIATGILSILLLTIIWTEFTEGGEANYKYIITVTMVFSILGQLFSWLGTCRSMIWSLVVSIALLSTELVFSVPIFFMYLKLVLQEFSLFDLFSLIIFSTIMVLTSVTIVLNYLHISRLNSLTQKQSNIKTLNDFKI